MGSDSTAFFVKINENNGRENTRLTKCQPRVDTWYRMTIDERLEKLVERHEALAGTVEMHDHALSRLESAAQQQQEMLKQQQEMLKQQQEMLKHQQEMLADLMRAVDKLVVRVLDNHEDRLQRLEGPQP